MPASIQSGFRVSGCHPFNRNTFTEDDFRPSLVTDLPVPVLNVNTCPVPAQAVNADPPPDPAVNDGPRLAPILKPGDHVAVKVEAHVGTFKPLWADIYVITKSKHPTYYSASCQLKRTCSPQRKEADPTAELRTAYSEEDEYINEDDSDGRVAPHVRVQGGESPPIAQTHSIPNSPGAAEFALVTPPPGGDQSPANRNATPLLSLHSKAQSPPITPVVPNLSVDTSVADTPPPPVRLLFSRRPQRKCRESETTWTCRPAS